MSIVRYIAAPIAGTVVLLVLGFFLYAVLFGGFFAANAEPEAAGIAKNPAEMQFIYLSELILAVLLCLVIGCWAGVSGAIPGLKTGAIFGFLMSLGISLMFYGAVNYMTLQATLFDVVLTTVRLALAGAVIGVILPRKRVRPADANIGAATS